jgi:integrase
VVGAEGALSATELRTWEASNKERTKQKLPRLTPLGLHELRHSYVSMMHAAGLTLEEIGDYVGHDSAWMTERYPHLLGGHEADAVKRFGRTCERDWRAALARALAEPNSLSFPS